MFSLGGRKGWWEVPWIKSNVDIGDNPKFKRLSDMLKIELPHAVGLVHLLWHFCLKYAPNGDLSKFSNAEISWGAKWLKNGDELVTALQNCAFLDDKKIHDWEDFAQPYLDLLRRKRRYKKGTEKGRRKDGERTDILHSRGEESRVDKRREEENDKHTPWLAWPKSEIKTAKENAYLYESPDGVSRVYEIEGQNPYIIDTPVKRLICAYKILTDIAPWDREWDKSKAGFSRCSHAAKGLLSDFSLPEAIKCLTEVKTYHEVKGLSWTLETVAKKAMDWKYGRLNGTN